MSNIQRYVRGYLLEDSKFKITEIDHKIYADIQTKKDVNNLYKEALIILKRLTEAYDLYDDDIHCLANAIAGYEIAVRKVMRMMEQSYSKWDYSLNKLIRLANQLDVLIEEYEEIQLRKLNQD